jgi:hypothetical protein
LTSVSNAIKCYSSLIMLPTNKLELEHSYSQVFWLVRPVAYAYFPFCEF